MDARKHEILFVSDVEKMYRQIWIDKSDWNYQRFVWRYDESEPLQEYVLTTVTFGEASAPFTAIRTLLQVAIDNENHSPIAARILSKDCYVDDIHFGHSTVTGVLQGRDELIKVLKDAGFTLRKWSSNNNEILKDLPREDVNPSQEIGFLGMKWNIETDSFSYPMLDLRIVAELTRRMMASEIAKAYDPLGWAQPLVILAKILLQDIWKTTVKWDDKVNADLSKKWIEIRRGLLLLPSISVPRWILLKEPYSIQIHGFSDASAKAYGCCIYLKCDWRCTVQFNPRQIKSRPH